MQKARELRAEKVREKELEDLTAEFRVKRDNIIRQAVHARSGTLLKRAAERHPILYRPSTTSLNTTRRLAAYQKGGMVAAEINAILAAEFCQDLLAPVVAAYADEKARILE